MTERDYLLLYHTKLLRCILQGLSDMSVERLVEQTLCKGQIVILHLEETPEDDSNHIQVRLFQRIQRMVASLSRRYPEFKANIVYIFTSNYEPTSIVSDFCQPLRMNAPGPTDQHEWCTRMLTTTLEKHNKARNVLDGCETITSIRIDPRALPHYEHDLRPLCNWWMSIAFHCGNMIERFRETQGKVDHTTVLFQISPNVSRVHNELSVNMTTSMSYTETVSLVCAGNHFYCDSQCDTSTSLVSLGVDQKIDTRIQSLSKMCLDKLLKPAVIVLSTSFRGKSAEGTLDRMYRGILESVRESIKCNEMQSHVTSLSLKSEEDKLKIYGEPSDVRGGLFQFIDDHNNPNCTSVSIANQSVVVVSALVNEVGQFMLRELLENTDGRSSTHRFSIRKDRVIFILRIEPGAKIQPQLESRAHVMLQIDAQENLTVRDYGAD